MLNTKENIDFKKVNTNLKKELSLLGFDISNQSCLNLLSRAIGYQNYNTYLGLNPEIIKIDKISIKNFLKEETHKFLRFYNKENALNYLEIERLVYLTNYNEYEVFIDKEVSSIGDKYFLQFRLKNNETKRVLFAPEFQSFSLYVYPSIEEAYSDYHFQINSFENKENLKYFFRDTIKHLDGKRWYCEEIHNDLLNLMDFIYNDIDSFSNILKQYPEEVIKEKYQNSVSDFFK
ncbi:hypothetical protein HOO34_07050 [Aliarcobacter cryaerophilus]|jgi:hypothetical protein|uniref:Uncharacterized protein n=1 Tax=Aliarcobacter cryaerophilus TaxID=28198 RepID=A0A2S9T4A2_9BACT|nr:hypothetical protein [Aliarcobacter cryaerophilus]MCT7433769.1 hypothetical protein [Aliarcobacter cryaerophilus]MCT7506469.1 hypothetical protein [Aliarcobacter cryaerophilus]PRM93660.1 hypothetical protein CJ673_09295 [Aliarcobacter cryaerophilus]QNM89429.1 hypothetical protein HOO34_07050 [Aliarcobacter cryaerophilus]